MSGKPRETVKSRPARLRGLLSCVMAAALGLAACHARDESGWSDGAAAAHKAADALVVQAKSAGGPPRQTDPATATLLDAVFNIAVMPSKPNVSQADAVADWIQSASRAGVLYLYAGTGMTDPRNLNVAQLSLEQQNIVTYAPEVGRYFDAELDLADALDQIFLLLRNDPQKYDVDAQGMHGAQMAAVGTERLIIGALNAIALPGVSDDWRRGRLGYLRNIAPDAARLLSSEQRNAVREAADAATAAMRDGDVKNQLVGISDSFLNR